MKIFISTDMEGVMGVSSWSEMEPGSRGRMYNDLLARELSWIIDELKQSSLDKDIEEICICDSHARGENLEFGALNDERITHIKGFPRAFYMMQGLDDSFDLVLFIGYHARVGAQWGIMDHSYSALCIYNVRIDGNPVGEVEINSFLAGHYGVPVGMVSGDHILQKELNDFFPEDFPFVRTKEGLGRFAGKMYGAGTIEKKYREETRRMIDGLDDLPVKRPGSTTTLELDFNTTVITDAVSVIPGLERTGGRSVRFAAEDYRDIYRMVLAAAMLGGRYADFK